MKRRRLACLMAMVCLAAVSISGCMDFRLTNPQALFTASEDEHVIPFTASFDATSSHNPSGDAISSYLWFFGDGGSDTGAVVDHVYKQDGVYDVTLTVFDVNGRTAKTSMTIQALNPLPVAEFSYSPRRALREDLIVSASQWITFDGAQSTDDGEVVSYQWYFGREEGEIQEAEGQIVEYRWLWPGTYSVVLTVTDDDGGSSRCVQQVRVIGNAPCGSDLTGDGWESCQ